MARLIVLEGPDRVGKETQSKLLTAYLRQLGHKATLVEVPVHDSLTYRAIYWMLHNGTAVQYPNVFQFVQYVNKRTFQEFVLADLMETNDFVILDRWVLSSIVYGMAAGVRIPWIAELSARLKTPDVTIVLHGKAHVDRHGDAYEKNKLLQEAVRFTYKQWALGHKDECELIDCEAPRMMVHNQIIAALQKRGVL